MQKMKRAQAAMEFLMTYGWALIAVLIVIAVLMNLNVFGAPEICRFESQGFSCSGQRLMSEYNANGRAVNNVIFTEIANNEPKAIEVLGLACVKGKRAPELAADGNFDEKAFRLDAGGLISDPAKTRLMLPGSETFNTASLGGGIKFMLQCLDFDSSGNVIEKKLVPGEDFRGSIFVAYRYHDDPAQMPIRISQATFSAKAQ